MPAQQRQTPTTGSSRATDAPTQEGVPEVSQGRGNAAANDQVPGGGDAGLANYEAALGSFLGGELYDAISGAISFDKMAGYANSATDSIIGALLDQVGKIDGVTADPKALDALSQLIGDKLDPFVTEWMNKDGKELTAKLADWVGAHPRTVATVALLAAVGAVIANVDVPTLKQKFSKGGFSGDVEASLGKVRSLSLEKIAARLNYASGPLLAAVNVSHEKGKTEGSGSIGLKDGRRQLSLDGSADGDGIKLWGLKGALETDFGTLGARYGGGRDQATIAGVSLTRQNGQTTTVDDFSYEQGSGVFRLGRSSLYDLGGGSNLSSRYSTGSDGSSEVGLGAQWKTENGSGSASWTHLSKKNGFELTEEDKLQLGMKYSKEDLKAQLDAALSTSGSGSLSGKVDSKLGGGFVGGGDLSATWGSGKTVYEAGAFYGFRDEKEFRTFLLDYRYKSGLDEQQFGLLVEQQLGAVYLRWKSQVTAGDNGRSLTSELQGAKPIGGDTSFIAGVKYDKDLLTGKNSFSPQVGVQYKNVPVILTYNPEQKSVMIGITIPFGR